MITSGFPSDHYSFRAWIAIAEEGLFATAATTVLWKTETSSGFSGWHFCNLRAAGRRVLGVSLLHERLGIMALAGGALIIAGAVYFSYKPEGSSVQVTWE